MINSNPGQAPGKPEKILIVGNGKSGTTALYFRIKKSLPGEVAGFFEPSCFEEIEKGPPQARLTIAKVLLPVEGGFLEQLSAFFDKKILIVRDPRDIIVSSLLYTGAYEVMWKKGAGEIRGCLDLLKAKESDPLSLPVTSLLQRLLDRPDLKGYADWISQRVSFTVRLSEDPSFFLFRYEELISDSLRPLENYLGFPLTTDTEIDKEFSRVVRTKKSASWRDWFLEEDMRFFRPLFQEFLERFGYDTEWTLHECRRIFPRHSSEYFRKVINERRSREGLSQI